MSSKITSSKMNFSIKSFKISCYVIWVVKKVTFYILDSVTSDSDEIIQQKNSETSPIVTQRQKPEITPLLNPVKNPDINLITFPM